jgi:hypothetical protein
VARSRSRGSRGSGRRANYAKPATEVGWRRFLPVGWANWLGFVMFAVIAIAMVVEVFSTAAEGKGADPFAAALMAGLTGWMTYLFATNRITD